MFHESLFFFLDTSPGRVINFPPRRPAAAMRMPGAGAKSQSREETICGARSVYGGSRNEGCGR